MAYTKYSEAPDAFHFWAGVSALAGALRSNVFFDQLYFRWTPSFYIIFVAPSGIATKSTSMDAGMNLLKELPEIKFGPDTLTWQRLAEALADAAVSIPANGSDVLDPNTEFTTVSCLTFAASELGVLLDPDDKTFVALLTHLWDGKKDFTKSTIMSGDVKSYNPWLNIIAGTTPGWIAANMNRVFITGGFVSRCIPVYADMKRQLVAYPKLLVREDLPKLRADLVHDLGEVAQLHGEYTLTPEAVTLGEIWYDKINKEPNKDLFGLDGYNSRKQGHVHKTAMVLAAARSDELLITAGILQEAITIVESLEPNMRKSFGMIGASVETEIASTLIGIMKLHKKLTYRALYKRLFQQYGIKVEDFGKLLSACTEAGYIKQISLGSGGEIIYSELSSLGEGNGEGA